MGRTWNMYNIVVEHCRNLVVGGIYNCIEKVEEPYNRDGQYACGIIFFACVMDARAFENIIDRLACTNSLLLPISSCSFVSSFDIGRRLVDGLVQKVFSFVVCYRCATGNVVETLVADTHYCVWGQSLATCARLLTQESLPLGVCVIVTA